MVPLSAFQRARLRNQRRHKCSSHIFGVGLLNVLVSPGLIEK
jgi:hypothetical protein